MRQVEKILREICRRVDIYADGWILKADGHWIVGYHFDINSDSSARLCDDKAATYQVLSQEDIPALVHKFYTKENLAGLQIKEKSVLKPNDGTGGEAVYRVQNQLEALKVGGDILKNHFGLAVSPFVEIKREYRALMLDGEIELLYVKEKPERGWKFNLGQGARPLILDRQDQVEALAKAAVFSLKIRFASVDVIEDQMGKFQILEVNSGVMMEVFANQSPENYAKAKEIYRKALS